MKFQNAQKTFSYGHRVWGPDNKCCHLHGHEATVVLQLSTPIIDDDASFQWFDRFVQMYVAGRMIVDINDPFINGLLDGGDLIVENGTPFLQLSKHYGRERLKLIPIIEGSDPTHLGYTLNINHWDANDPKRQFYGSFTLVNFNPNDYNCAKWFYELAQAHLHSTRWELLQTNWQWSIYATSYSPAKTQKKEA